MIVVKFARGLLPTLLSTVKDSGTYPTTHMVAALGHTTCWSAISHYTLQPCCLQLGPLVVQSNYRSAVRRCRPQ